MCDSYVREYQSQESVLIVITEKRRALAASRTIHGKYVKAHIAFAVDLLLHAQLSQSADDDG